MISSCEGITVVPTPLMCVEVAAIVTPYHQALLRCAGSAGIDVYEEVVERGKAPMHIEYTNRPDGVEDNIIRHAPTIHLAPVDAIESLGDTAVLVVTREYLAMCDKMIYWVVRSASNPQPIRRKGAKTTPVSSVAPASKIPMVRKLRYIYDRNDDGLDTTGYPTLPERFERGFEDFEFCGHSGIDTLCSFMSYSPIITLTLTGCGNVTSLEEFLNGCPALSSIDFSGLSNVTTIGKAFLFHCPALTSIDLSPFANVTSVGIKFMAHCISITTIDLSPLKHVTTIPDGFMDGCTALTSIDLTPFANVTSVGANFMGRCTSLTAVDLNPLANVASVGFFFMSGCSTLISIDFSPLRNVRSMQGGFLNECTFLTSITGIASLLRNISDDNHFCYSFLDGCPSLTSINFGSLGDPICNTTNLGEYFMREGKSITTIDLSLFANVATIGPHFMAGCTSLTTITLSPLCNITKVGDYFMRQCSTLKAINLSPFSSLTKVGSYFMAECTSIKSIDLGPLKNVATIGPYFMAGCSAITAIDLGPFARVTTIGECCLMNCTSIATIDLTPLVSLKWLGGTFMNHCTALKPTKRTQFLKVVKDRLNGVVVPVATTPAIAARKVVVRAAVKKKVAVVKVEATCKNKVKVKTPGKTKSK